MLIGTGVLVSSTSNPIQASEAYRAPVALESAYATQTSFSATQTPFSVTQTPFSITQTPLSATQTPYVAEPLFAAATSPGRDYPWPSIVRKRFITINHALLTSTNRFTLNMFSDTSLTAVLEQRQDRREALGPAAGDGFIWRGHIENVEQSQVTLVVGDDTVVGNIYLPDVSNHYHIGYAGDGTSDVYAVYEIDHHQIPRGQGLIPEELNPFSSNEVPDPPPALCTGCSTAIGYLVLYTPAAKAWIGGQKHLENAVALGVDYANIAYTNSNINQQLSLNNIREIDYVEFYSTVPPNVGYFPRIDLDRLTFPNDGWMDIVHHEEGSYERGWRQIDRADLVSLVEHAKFGGLGWIFADEDPAWGFNNFDIDALSQGGGILAHELGHNMGCGHARHNGTGGYRTWSWGYGDITGRFHDIMAYDCPTGAGGPCPQIQQFSNPDVLYCPCTGPDCPQVCLPTGIPYQEPDSADCARTFTETGPIISNWR